MTETEGCNQQIEPEYVQLTFFCEPIPIFTDCLAEDEDVELDKKEFIRGLKDASYPAGILTGLINCGISIEDSLNYLYVKMNNDTNIELARINANANVESSKNTSVIMEKNQI